MKVHSYIVARDYGFAPNPFFGYCTLATCKPRIRARANIDDWVIGTGAIGSYNYQGRLIYAMQVSEVMSFDDYWNDSRFYLKRPNLIGSLKLLYGDNIYYRNGNEWIQESSHHSLSNGTNLKNLETDTSVNRLLIAKKFVYWGKLAPIIPNDFRSFGEHRKDICHSGIGDTTIDGELSRRFIEWLEGEGNWGVQGEPLEFQSHTCQLQLKF
jgi:hypothetical protein